MPKTITDFFDEVGGGLKPEFRAEPWYSPVGDSIHFHWSESEYFGDRIDDKLTVYRSTDTDEAVGCQIKGVSALLRKLGDFDIRLDSPDGTPLALFLITWPTDETEGDTAKRREVYGYILEHVRTKKVSVPIQPPADAVHA